MLPCKCKVFIWGREMLVSEISVLKNSVSLASSKDNSLGQVCNNRNEVFGQQKVNESKVCVNDFGLSVFMKKICDKLCNKDCKINYYA